MYCMQFEQSVILVDQLFDVSLDNQIYEDLEDIQLEFIQIMDHDRCIKNTLCLFIQIRHQIYHQEQRQYELHIM
jgi:hypothetical protein